MASRRSAPPLRTILLRRCIAAVVSPRITFTARQQTRAVAASCQVEIIPVLVQSRDVRITSQSIAVQRTSRSHVVLCRDTVKAMRYRVGGILLLCALRLAVPAADANASGCDGVIVGAGSGPLRQAGRHFQGLPRCAPRWWSFRPANSRWVPKRRSDETPVHEVALARPFAVGKFEVTFAEWDACVADGACSACAGRSRLRPRRAGR